MLMSASPGRGGDGAGADRAQRATGSSTTDRKICSTVSGALSLARSALPPLRRQRNLAALTLARAREGRPIPASSDADTDLHRPALGGAAAAGRRRQFFLAEFVSSADSGATMELGRSGDRCMTSASPGRGGGDGDGAGRVQRGTGSSNKDRKICSTVSGGACSRSRSAAAAAAWKDQRNLAALTTFVALTRARRAPTRRARSADRPAQRQTRWATWAVLWLLAAVAPSFSRKSF